MARFPLPLDREMDWNEILDVNGSSTRRAGLLPPEKVTAAISSLPSGPKVQPSVRKAELRSSHSLLFIVATAFLFNSLFFF